MRRSAHIWVQPARNRMYLRRKRMQEAGKQLGISPVIGERFYQRMIMIGRQAVAGGVRYMDAVTPQQPEHIDIAVKIYIHGFRVPHKVSWKVGSR